MEVIQNMLTVSLQLALRELSDEVQGHILWRKYYFMETIPEAQDFDFLLDKIAVIT